MYVFSFISKIQKKGSSAPGRKYFREYFSKDSEESKVQISKYRIFSWLIENFDLCVFCMHFLSTQTHIESQFDGRFVFYKKFYIRNDTCERP